MIERVSSSEGEYHVIRPGEALSEDFRDEYWGRVKRTLQRVFHGNPTDADRLRDKINAAPEETQTIFYHADPFEVAADLAGRREGPISQEEQEEYLRTEERADRPVREELGRTHPEE